MKRGCSPPAPCPGAFLPLGMRLFLRSSSQSGGGTCVLLEKSSSWEQGLYPAQGHGAAPGLGSVPRTRREP